MTERREPTGHPIRELMQYFDGLYQREYRRKYPFIGGKAAKRIKELREVYSDDEIRGFMIAYFEMDDPFIQQTGHSFEAFGGCLPKIFLYLQHGSVKPKETPKNLTGIGDWARKRAAGQ